LCSRRCLYAVLRVSEELYTEKLIREAGSEGGAERLNYEPYDS